MRLLVACLLFLVAAVAHAGTTEIHVDTEEGGTVVTGSGAVNQKGTLFWNGSTWVSNDTAAHMYFTDLRTGLRLKEYTTTIYQGSQPGTLTRDNCSIQRSLYTYQKNGADGIFSFSAVQYRIHNNAAGKDVILRSRGLGAGTENAYFDVYVEDPVGGNVTAMRGDPVWFTYPMSIDDALHWTSATAYKTGDLPSSDNNYWLDQNGGSDMGGLTYQLHTATLPVADPALSLGSSFPVYFSYKYMDSSNQLQELRFLPYAEGRKSTTPGFRDVGSMAQIASSKYWKTSITLVNHGGAAATARVSFFDDSGQPLALPIAYPSLPPADPVMLSTVERRIDPSASFSFSTTGPDDVGSVGWARMLSDGDITGFAVFRQKVHREQEAVVPLETHNTDAYVLWFNNSGDFATGLAVANSSASAASIPVIVRDEAGNQIHTETLELPAMGHISGALSAIIDNTGGKVGSVEFRTPQGGQISVLGLRFNGISFTTIPVLDRPLQTATAAPLPLLIPAGSAAQLASGHYWETSITLVNKGNSPARTKIDFFDNPGNPLALPVRFPSMPSVPAAMMPTLERTLAPGEALSFSSTDPASTADTVGWARLSTDGDVGGFAIFRQDVDGAQEALVPMENVNPDAWLVWFDNTGTFSSGLAVVNNSVSPASVQVIVRDEAGAEIHTQTLELPGLGHVSGAMTDMIGNTAGKVGSVEFRGPQNGAITVLGLRFNGVSFTTIPVMPRAVS